jgi:hypothetical protein
VPETRHAAIPCCYLTGRASRVAESGEIPGFLG